MSLLTINLFILGNFIFLGTFIFLGNADSGNAHIFFFQVLVLFFALALYIILTRQVKKYAFVFIVTALFLAGSYAPFLDNYFGEGLKSFSHLVEDETPNAMAYLSLCYTGMMLGFMFRWKSNGNRTFPMVEFKGGNGTLLGIGFWLLFLIWIYLCSVSLGGIMGIFHSEAARASNQFTATILEQLLLVVVRICTLVVGLIAVLAYERNNKKGLDWRTWLVIVFWFLVCLSQYDRGKFFELLFIILGCKLLIRPKLKSLRSAFSVLSIMVIVILLNANGRYYHATGLLNIVDAFAYGSAEKLEKKGEVVTLLPEVGALPMITTVMDMREKGISLPANYLLYQVNPLPTAIIPKDLKPDRFFERYLGTYGNSGTPVPIGALSYMGFGYLGFFVFILIGVVFKWLSSLPTSIEYQGVKLFYPAGLLILPMAYGGLMYTLMHGEPRGPIRLCVYAWILSLMLRSLLKSRYIKIGDSSAAK
jgi:hypothetical protein